MGFHHFGVFLGVPPFKETPIYIYTYIRIYVYILVVIFFEVGNLSCIVATTTFYVYMPN